MIGVYTNLSPSETQVEVKMVNFCNKLENFRQKKKTKKNISLSSS